MRRKLTVAGALALAVLGLLAGCSPLSNRLKGIPNGSLLSQVKSALRATLPNGLAVVVVHSSLAPVVSSVLTYKVGSADAPASFPGIAHAMQLLTFSGGPGLSTDQFAAAARAIGGDISAQTTETQTRFVYTVPTGDLAAALHLEAAGMKGISSDPNQWTTVQGSLTAEIEADNSNPQYSIYARLRADLLHGSSYAHDALGNANKIGSVSLADLRKFHSAWYVPNNAVLVVVGDVAPQTVLSEVKRFFGPIAAGKTPKTSLEKAGAVKPESLALVSRLAYGAAAVAFRLPGSTSPDYPAALVLSDIIKNAPDGLGNLVASGTAFGAGFTYDAFPDAGIGMAVGTYSQGQGGSAVKDQLKIALSKYMNGGISAAAVDSAKLRTVMLLEKNLDGVQRAAVAWAAAVASGHKSPLSLVDAVRAVTATEVNHVAIRYIDLGKADFATLTPLQSGPTIPLSSQGFGGLEPIDLSGASPAPTPEWARGVSTKVATPSSAKPTDVRLRNGLRLIIQPERGTSVIDLFGLVDSNPYMEVPQGKGGIDEVLGQLMTDGTSSLDKAKYQAALDKIGAVESAGTDFSLTVLRSEFGAGVDLLSQNLLHPRLTSRDFEIEKKLIAQIAAARAQNPSAKARHAFLKAVLPAKDPALRQASESEVKSLTLPEVKSYYESVFRPDMTTVVVVGDVSPDAVRSIITRYFGGWKNTGKTPRILLPRGRQNKASRTTVADPESSIDQVRLAELIPMVRSNPQYYALKAANEILSGGVYPGRFASDLNDRNLPVSFLSASYISGRARTFYLIDFAAEPSDVSQISGLIRSDIASLEKHPATRQEFDRARGTLLRSLLLSRTSYGEIGNSLLNDARLHLPLDEDSAAAKAYAALTSREVSSALKEWVRPADLAEVVQGP